jgi:hypothetical protein
MCRACFVLLVLVFSICLLGGCYKYSVKLLREPNSTSPSFNWIDARSFEQRESGHESLLSTDCAYGIYRIGDDKFHPDRVALLRSDLDAAIGEYLKNKTVILRNYVVHFNRAREFRESVAATNKGLIAEVLNDVSTHGCSSSDLQGGYDSTEVANEESPLVVVIDVEVDCRTVHARWVASAKEPALSFDKSNHVWNEWVSGAIDGATKNLVAKLQTESGASAVECVNSYFSKSE